MGMLPITEQGKPVACHQQWPLYYMGDFSRLGLVVGRLDEVLETLKVGGFRVLNGEAGYAVAIDGPEQVEAIFSALRAAQVPFEVADLISCAYQG